MTKSWTGGFAFALPLLYAVLTGQLGRQRRYWLGAILIGSAIVLPWHLLQLWLHGTAFLHDYFVVNVVGRVFNLVEQTNRGSLFYFGVIHQGFSYFASICALAYVHTVLSIRGQHTRQKLLLLIWSVVPLLLFSLATTKLGWYVMLTYPALALITGNSLVQFFGARTAVAITAAAMAVLCFRLPADVDGSPGTRDFVRSVSQIVPAEIPIYVYSKTDCRTGGTLTQYAPNTGMC
jgi:4-amino-4-deoxy-L-arabinose transferase-like glycosyltransferase